MYIEKRWHVAIEGTANMINIDQSRRCIEDVPAHFMVVLSFVYGDTASRNKRPSRSARDPPHNLSFYFWKASIRQRLPATFSCLFHFDRGVIERLTVKQRLHYNATVFQQRQFSVPVSKFTVLPYLSPIDIQKGSPSLPKSCA